MKRVGSTWYAARGAWQHEFPPDAVRAVRRAKKRRSVPMDYDLVKYSRRTGAVTLMQYFGLRVMPFPQLVASWTIAAGGQVTKRRYRSETAPLLHRKELLIEPLLAEAALSRELTQILEEEGLAEQAGRANRAHTWWPLVHSNERVMRFIREHWLHHC